MRNPPSIRMRASRANVAALQETATTTGRALAANCRACASAPARGGSKRAPSNPESSLAPSGRRKRSRVSVATGLRPAVPAAASSEGPDRRGVRIDGEDLVRAREAEREGAGAAEEVGDPLRAFQRLIGDRRQPRLSVFGRLKKAAGRQRDQRVAEGDARRPALDDDRAVVGDAGEVERLGGADELARFRRIPAGRRRADRRRGPRASPSRRCRAAWPAPRRSAASARAAAIAPAISGANSGQASIATMACDRARMKPTSSGAP